MAIGGGRKGNRPSAPLPLPIFIRNIPGLEFLVSHSKQRLAPKPNRNILPLFHFRSAGSAARSRLSCRRASSPPCLAFSVPLCLSSALRSVLR